MGPKYTGRRKSSRRLAAQIAGSACEGSQDGAGDEESQVIVRARHWSRCWRRSASCQAMFDKAAAQAKQVPRFEVDPFWPKPMPNNYVFGHDHRPRHLVRRSRLGHPPRQRPGQPRSHRDWRSRRKARPRVSECCNPAPPVMEFDAAGNNVGSWGGPVAGAPYRLAREQPRHRRRSQGLRVDRRQRRARLAHPEVHARRQVRGAVRQARRAQGRQASPGRQAGLPVEQPRHGQLRPRREDLHRPEGERRLRR